MTKLRHARRFKQMTQPKLFTLVLKTANVCIAGTRHGDFVTASSENLDGLGF